MSSGTWLFNKEDELYFFKIEMSRGDAGEFLMEMWESVMGKDFCPQTVDDALSEWTDRIREVRSTYQAGEVCVYRHGYEPSRDKMELPEKVLEFLKLKDYEVTDD